MTSIRLCFDADSMERGLLVALRARSVDAIIYVPDEDPESVFVITAYELRGKAKTAYRRRQRRKPR
jgi:hypothetical protein